MSALPSVSVVICNYNYGHFVADAINSAMTQRQSAKEIVVVDDGSTDNSLEVIASFGEQVKVIAKANGGQMSAYNAGFEQITGDVVIFLDSDDRLLPDVVGEVSQAMKAVDVARVHFKLELIDHTGNKQGGVIPTLLAEGDLAPSVRKGQLFLAAPGSGNAYRVSALAEIMPLPSTPQEKHGADFFAGYASAFLGKVVAIARPLGQYRVHEAIEAQSIRFGNAKLGRRGAQMIQGRYSHMRQWLARIRPQEKLAEQAIVDFSIQKQDFALSIFGPDHYLDGLKAGLIELPAVLRSIVLRDASLIMKFGLGGWAIFVLIAPRAWGRPVARYVCNPSSRGLAQSSS